MRGHLSNPGISRLSRFFRTALTAGFFAFGFASPPGIEEPGDDYSATRKMVMVR